MKQTVKTIISFVLAGSLLIGCYSHTLNVVEVKALFVSADILQKNPVLNHYLDVLKLTDFIITSFYIKQNVAKGKIPKKSSDNPFGNSHQTSNGLVFTMTSSIEFKNFQDNSFYSVNGFNHQVNDWLHMQVLDDISRSSAVSQKGVGGAFIAIMLLILCVVRPRSDVSDLITNNLHTIKNPASLLSRVFYLGELL